MTGHLLWPGLLCAHRQEDRDDDGGHGGGYGGHGGSDGGGEDISFLTKNICGKGSTLAINPV